MYQEQILFADKKIVVTTTEFVVDSVRYLLNGISAVRTHFVRHYKYPPYTLVALGLAAILAGVSGIFSNIQLEELYIGDVLITAGKLAVMIGVVFMLLGLLWLSVLNNEYVVVITTVTGVSIPISSRKKNYIDQIVNAIKSAMYFQQISPDKKL